MAEGRMLRRKIAIDKRLAQLSSDRARLLFTWCIPFLDVEGRMSGDPSVVKALVFPMLKTFTEQTIADDIAECAAIGLVQKYSVNGETYLAFPGFAKNQQLRREREAPSQIPPPSEGNSGRPPGVLPEHSRSTPAEVKEVKEVKNIALRGEDESSSREQPPSHKTWLTEPAGIWTAAYGGEFPFAKAAGLLKSVLDAVGIDELCRRLRHYVRATDAPFASLAKFRETHGSYTSPSARRVNGQGEDPWANLPEVHDCCGRCGSFHVGDEKCSEAKGEETRAR